MPYSVRDRKMGHRVGGMFREMSQALADTFGDMFAKIGGVIYYIFFAGLILVGGLLLLGMLAAVIAIIGMLAGVPGTPGH